MKINTFNIKNPDILGELLREITFTGVGLGCYSNFEVSKALIPITEKEINDKLSLIPAFKDQLFQEWKGYSNLDSTFYVFWMWDGDGTLIFIDNNRVLYNDDCKKTHSWEEYWITQNSEFVD